MLPKATVLITTYSKPEKREQNSRYLDEAIKSALSQDYKDMQILIVDDGTKPQFKDEVLKYNDERITYHYMPQNKGLPFALIKGVQIARGKYIAILDQDDRLTPGSIELRVNQLENTNAGFCYGSSDTINAQGEFIKHIQPEKINSYEELKDKAFMSKTGMFMHTSMMIDRLKALDVGNYEHGKIFDYHLMLKIAKKHGLTHIDDTVVQYRLHPDSTSAQFSYRLTTAIDKYRTARDFLTMPQTIEYFAKRAVYVAQKWTHMLRHGKTQFNEDVFYKEK